ncbi:MAG: TIGR04255 family protein [Candidatus Gracilibacteria bacterium]
MSNSFKKNYIDTVIFRIDFDNINLEKISEFSKEIESDFPFISPKNILSKMFSVDEKGELSKVQQNTIIWVSKSIDGTKHLEIGNNYLFIEYKTYENRDKLIEDIRFIKIFLNLFGIEVIKRVGLRYINLIKDEKIKEVVDWNEYINNHLLGNINFLLDDEDKLGLRYMSNIYIKEDKYRININSGIFNNDYPNIISNQEFVLDYDCSTSYPITFSETEYDIIDTVKQMNDIISKLFIKSIEKKLIDLMNE